MNGKAVKMRDTKEHSAWRRCPECLEAVPYKVRICPNCKSYQDWRRFVAIGQTNIALLVALISVLTTLISLGLPLLESPTSRVNVVYDSDDFQYGGEGNTAKATFFVRNDGKAGGIIRLDRLVLHARGRTETATYRFMHEPFYVSAGKEEKLVASFQRQEPKTYPDFGVRTAMCQELPRANYMLASARRVLEQVMVVNPSDTAMRDVIIERFSRRGFRAEITTNLDCRISFYETNYTEASRFRWKELGCGDVSFIKHCLGAKFDGTSKD